MVIAFVVRDKPIPLPRPRVTMVRGFAHAYLPATAVHSQALISAAAVVALGGREPFSGPVAVRIDVILPVPKSLPKKYWGNIRPSRRPDADNFVKQALDGCHRLWRDDAQVVDLEAHKWYAWEGEPRWEIEVRDTAE
jgi:Holliday junction resolvase RusA-like endonuclease